MIYYLISNYGWVLIVLIGGVGLGIIGYLFVKSGFRKEVFVIPSYTINKKQRKIRKIKK